MRYIVIAITNNFIDSYHELKNYYKALAVMKNIAKQIMPEKETWEVKEELKQELISNEYSTINLITKD